MAFSTAAQQVDFIQQRCLQLFELFRVLEFSLVFVEHIKDVDDLVDICGDAGEMDGESVVKQSSGQRVEQSLCVGRKDIDDGKSFRAIVVDSHLRFLTHDHRVLAIDPIQAAASEHAFDCLAAGQNISDRHGYILYS